MKTAPEIKTIWNGSFISINKDGRPVFASGDRHFHNRAPINTKSGDTVNPGIFIAKETGEECYSVKHAAKVMNILEPSMQNRVSKGRAICYKASHPQASRLRLMNALPSWQFDRRYAYVLESIYHGFAWSRERSMTDFIRTYHPELDCTPQQAIIDGRGDKVLTVVKSMT